MSSSTTVVLIAVAFLLICWQRRVYAVASSYYSIVVLSDRSSNFYHLECRTISVANLALHNSPFQQAQWLYNSLNYTENGCFNNATRSGASLEFNLTSECDGYMQCGNGTEYSQVLTLIAPIQRTPEYSPNNIRMTRAVGSSVRLPCNVRVSAIEGHTLRWFMASGSGQLSDVPDEFFNDDYSLTLDNLQLSVSAYTCRVLTLDGTKVTVGQTYELVVVEYRSPDIGDLTARRQEDSDILSFKLSANGTNLNYTWYLDGRIITDVQTSSQPHSGTSVLRLMPSDDSRSLKNLSVVISNIDSTNDNEIRQDSATVWLYQNVISDCETTSSSLPTATTTPTTGVMEKNIVYISAGAVGAIVVVAFIIATLLGCICCYKLVHYCTLFKVEMKQVDRFSSKMTSLLLEVKTTEQVTPEVKKKIDDLFLQLRTALNSEPPTNCTTEPMVPDGKCTSNYENIELKSSSSPCRELVGLKRDFLLKFLPQTVDKLQSGC